jgi:hypothetical protein
MITHIATLRFIYGISIYCCINIFLINCHLHNAGGGLAVERAGERAAASRWSTGARATLITLGVLGSDELEGGEELREAELGRRFL